MDQQSNLEDRTYRTDYTRHIQGEDKVHIISILSIGISNAEEAMDNAIEKLPNVVALSDVTIKKKFFYIPFIYGQSSFIVEGNPVYRK